MISCPGRTLHDRIDMVTRHMMPCLVRIVTICTWLATLRAHFQTSVASLNYIWGLRGKWYFCTLCNRDKKLWNHCHAIQNGFPIWRDNWNMITCHKLACNKWLDASLQSDSSWQGPLEFKCSAILLNRCSKLSVVLFECLWIVYHTTVHTHNPLSHLCLCYLFPVGRRP